MSSNSADLSSVVSLPVRALVYLDMAARPAPPVNPTGKPLSDQSEEVSRRRPEVEMSKEEFARRIQTERAEAVEQTEQRLASEYERKLEAALAPIAAAVGEFGMQREQYFVCAEAEIVQLALAIAAKILHREAQVDPMLVATLVRMAVDKMREGSTVTIRVGAAQAPRWQQYFAVQTEDSRVHVVEDVELSDQDCMVETELGVANFGLDAQLKEVEQGFFDLMALRPVKG